MSKDRTYREQIISGNLSAANCRPLVLYSIENHHQPIDRAGEGAEIQRIDPDRWREIGDAAGCGSPPRVGEIGQRPVMKMPMTPTMRNRIALLFPGAPFAVASLADERAGPRRRSKQFFCQTVAA